MLNLALKFALLLVLLSTIPTKAQEAKPFQGIFCESEDQIRKVVSVGTEMGGAIHGINAVNKETGSSACIHVTIVGIRQKSVGSIMTPEGKLDITPFEVKAIMTPFGLVEREPVVWYSLADPIGQEI